MLRVWGRKTMKKTDAYSCIKKKVSKWHQHGKYCVMNCVVELLHFVTCSHHDYFTRVYFFLYPLLVCSHLVPLTSFLYSLPNHHPPPLPNYFLSVLVQLVIVCTLFHTFHLWHIFYDFSHFPFPNTVYVMTGTMHCS